MCSNNCCLEIKMNDIITIKCPKDKLTLLDMWKYNLCIQEGGFVKGVYNGMCDDYDSDGPTKYSNFKEFINGEFPQVKKNAYLKTVLGGLNFDVAQFENEKQFKEQFDIEDTKENFSLQDLTNKLNQITFSSGECVGQLSRYRNGYKLCIYEHNSTCYTKRDLLQSIKNHFEDEIKCLGNDIRIKFDISWDSLEQTILDDTFKSSFMYKI